MASMSVNNTQPLMKPNQLDYRGAQGGTLRYDAGSQQGPSYWDLPFTWADTVELQSQVKKPAEKLPDPVKPAPAQAPAEKTGQNNSSKPIAPVGTKPEKSPKFDVESAISEIFERGGDLEVFLEAAEEAKEIRRQAKEEARQILLDAFHNGDDLHEATLKAKSIRSKAFIEAEDLAMEAYAAAMLSTMDEEGDAEEIPEDEPDWQQVIYSGRNYFPAIDPSSSSTQKTPQPNLAEQAFQAADGAVHWAEDTAGAIGKGVEDGAKAVATGAID
ncbi:MAG TPA: hypothetical protein V6C82_00160, partial [Chroococcales cyanobacterium]